MTVDKDESVTYSFSYVNKFTGENNTYSRTYPDSWITWDTVLEDFLQFLSGCYGYSVHEQVSVEPHRYGNPLDE